jgi:predicted ATPase
MERLIVKDFIVLKKIDMKVQNINVIIGEQASGKSLVAKLLYYFKDFITKMSEIIDIEHGKKDFDKRMISLFFEYFPIESWGEADFEIKYTYNKLFIEVKRNSKNTIKLSYSEEYKTIISKHKSYLRVKERQQVETDQGIIVRDMSESRSDFFNRVEKNITNHFSKNQIFIPAGRAFFANLQSSIFSFLATNNAIDPFLKKFGSDYETSKDIINIFARRSKKMEIDTKGIIEGEYQRIKGKDYLVFGQRKTTVNMASSGQQEVLPLLLILRTLNIRIDPNEVGKVVYIEEPEAHLFPKAQLAVMKLIIKMFNVGMNRFQFVITTHSPYVLTAINNSILAGKITNERTLNEVKDVFDINAAIGPNEKVAAYSLENGKLIDIVEAETGMIDGEVLDDVSNEIAREFEDLLEIGDRYDLL